MKIRINKKNTILKENLTDKIGLGGFLGVLKGKVRVFIIALLPDRSDVKDLKFMIMEYQGEIKPWDTSIDITNPETTIEDVGMSLAEELNDSGQQQTDQWDPDYDPDNDDPRDTTTTAKRITKALKQDKDFLTLWDSRDKDPFYNW